MMSMMNSNKVKVTILGQVYTIEADASSGYISRIAEYVNSKMEEVAKNISKASPQQIAILAALNIADELFQTKDGEHIAADEMKEKTNVLISMLDEGLIGDIYSIRGKHR